MARVFDGFIEREVVLTRSEVEAIVDRDLETNLVASFAAKMPAQARAVLVELILSGEYPLTADMRLKGVSYGRRGRRSNPHLGELN
jgi:hypothetical protein